MPHAALQIIREEHAAVAAVLRSLSAMLDQGPGDTPERFFDVMRTMLSPKDWAELDAAFAATRDPLAGGLRDPNYDRLFTRIVMAAPTPPVDAAPAGPHAA